MKIDPLRCGWERDIVKKYSSDKIILTAQELRDIITAHCDSKPECGEKEEPIIPSKIFTGCSKCGEAKVQTYVRDTICDECLEKAAVGKLTKAYNKAVANGESNMFKPKEVEKMRYAEDGKPLGYAQQTESKPKDSLEEIIIARLHDPQGRLGLYRTQVGPIAVWLATAIRKHLLGRVEGLRIAIPTPNGEHYNNAIDDVRRLINEKE